MKSEKLIRKLLEKHIVKSYNKYVVFSAELEHQDFLKENPGISVSKKDYLLAIIRFAKNKNIRLLIDFTDEIDSIVLIEETEENDE